MPNIVTNQLKINNSKNFIDSISLSSGNSLYMFLARPNDWADNTNIPIPIDSQENITKIWDEMISLKRVFPENIIHVVKRIDWTSGITYNEYNNTDINLFDKSFYFPTHSNDL